MQVHTQRNYNYVQFHFEMFNSDKELIWQPCIVISDYLRLILWRICFPSPLPVVTRWGSICSVSWLLIICRCGFVWLKPFAGRRLMSTEHPFKTNGEMKTNCCCDFLDKSWCVLLETVLQLLCPRDASPGYLTPLPVWTQGPLGHSQLCTKSDPSF